jgi:hypothetical protein
MRYETLNPSDIAPREGPHRRDVLRSLRNAAKNGVWENVPPIIVLDIPPRSDIGTRYVVLDGNNRYAIAKRYGLEITAIIPENTDELRNLLYTGFPCPWKQRMKIFWTAVLSPRAITKIPDKRSGGESCQELYYKLCNFPESPFPSFE